MSKRTFTKEQIGELLKNENVIKCTEKMITYSQAFKRKAVRQYRQECLSVKEIFRQAGFNPETNSSKQPTECLRRWNNIYKADGIDGLVESRRVSERDISKKLGRPKTKNLTDADKIERLEAQVAYLKAENDFLAKLRAKRRE